MTQPTLKLVFTTTIDPCWWEDWVGEDGFGNDPTSQEFRNALAAWLEEESVLTDVLFEDTYTVTVEVQEPTP